MQPEGDAQVSITWSRAELVAVREAMELTPLFGGRAEVRETIRRTLRARRTTEIALDLTVAERLAANLVALDMQTAIAKSTLHRVIRETQKLVEAERAAQDAAAAEAA